MVNRRPGTSPMRLILAMALLAASDGSVASAQDFPYTMTVASEPYVPLAQFLIELPEEELLRSTIKGDNADNSLPAFSFLGHTLDTIQIFPRGTVAIFTRDTGWTGQISALPSDWVPRSIFDASDGSSAFGLTMTGAVGSRILQIEWRNMTVRNDIADDGLDSINYQLWMYEGSNMFEIRVGPNSVASQFSDFEEPVSGPSLGLIEIPSEQIPNPRGVYYTGDPGAPVMNNWSLGMSFGYLQGFPAEGTVYRFTLGSSGVAREHLIVDRVAAAPNPAGTFSMIRFALRQPAECRLLLHDALGEERGRLELGRLASGEQSVRLGTDEIPPGVYFYTLEVDGLGMTREIIVAR